jgi:hypothetical protein
MRALAVGVFMIAILGSYQDRGAAAPPDENEGGASQVLSEQELEQLLGERLNGGMGESFSKFANMFLVSSMINGPRRLALVTSSPEIAKAELQPLFPRSYEPTLREFLDAIALQTKSNWKLDDSGKYIKDETGGAAPFDDLPVFEFSPAKRAKPFEITLADGWKSKDQGHWLMLSPPSFPVGLDVYEMGTYSIDEGDKKKLLDIRTDVAMEWAGRVKDGVERDDLRTVKVGPFEALYFEAMIPSRMDEEIHWRQWVFMADNQCYFIVSTILPELDEKIFPDVEKMLASFRVKDKKVQKSADSNPDKADAAVSDAEAP